MPARARSDAPHGRQAPIRHLDLHVEAVRHGGGAGVAGAPPWGPQGPAAPPEGQGRVAAPRAEPAGERRRIDRRQAIGDCAGRHLRKDDRVEPVVEPAGWDEAYALAGPGDPGEFARRGQARIRERTSLSGAGGIGDNKARAKIASGLGKAGGGFRLDAANRDGVMAGRAWAAGEVVGMAECAAAPSLFYADWTHEIPAELEHLRAYRARLLARPSVARAVEEARPYRHLFPLGAPDRD